MHRWSTTAQLALLSVLTLLLGAGFVVMVLIGSSGRGVTSAPADAQAVPLLLPPPVTDPGGYAFLQTTAGGGPVRWDPCRPVHVVVRPDREPPGGREAVRAALDEVGAGAGLVFVIDGETDEAPSPDRDALDVGRYGSRWSPVLLSWSDASEYPPLAGAVGVAGPAATEVGSDGAGVRYVSGTVTLDADWFGVALQDAVGRRQAAAVLRHELAHLVGLGHSRDPFSLMSPQYQSVFSFSLADRAGLARLGAGPCAQGS